MDAFDLEAARPVGSHPDLFSEGVVSPVYASVAAAFTDKLRADRERRGLTIARAAWRIGVKPAEYRELEAGTRWPTFEAWDAICKLYGWPRTFVDGVRR